MKIKRLFIRRPNGRLMTDTTHVVECPDDYSFSLSFDIYFLGYLLFAWVSLSLHFERNEMNERASVYYTFSRTAATYIHARRIYTIILDLCHFLFFLDRNLWTDICWPSSLTHWRPTRRAGTYCCRPGRKWAVYDGLIHLHVYLTYYYYTFLFRIIYMFPCWPTWHRRRDSTTHSPVKRYVLAL